VLSVHLGTLLVRMCFGLFAFFCSTQMSKATASTHSTYLMPFVGSH
jgi:hypothetical protein